MLITEVKDGKVVLRNREEIKKEMETKELVFNKTDLAKALCQPRINLEGIDFLPKNIMSNTEIVFKKMLENKIGEYEKILDRGFMLEIISQEVETIGTCFIEHRVKLKEVPIPLTGKECFGVRLNEWQMRILENIRRACACNEAKTMMCFKKYLQNNGFLSKE